MIDETRLRAWWWHRQGLDGALRGARPVEVLERAGWARSVGGAGPYLTLFARAGTTRQVADDAVARLEIHELPAARGCTYVLPASDYAIGLRAGLSFADAPLRTAATLGVTATEVDRLCAAVLRALEAGPLDPDGIREATGDASRSLGEPGRKKGIATTLPLALGRLQASGDIRRVPVNGRLDQQRYAYTLWSPNPLASYDGSERDALTEVARRFFRWVGPATLRELQWFCGLGVKAAQEIAAPLALVPAEPASERLLLPEDVEAFHSFEPREEPQYRLVGSLDSISATRRDVRTLLDPADVDREVAVGGARHALGTLADLPNHAILDRGRLIGLWEYDVDSGTIACAAFGVKDRALATEVDDMEAYVRSQLGDARSYSLDSAKSRAPRIAALRAMR